MPSHNADFSSLQGIPPGSPRPRRLRFNAELRDSLQENTLKKSDFICPIFVSDSAQERELIPQLPDIFRIPCSLLETECEEIIELGLRKIMLFPVISPDLKDIHGTEAHNASGLMFKCIKLIKKKYPQIIIFVDVALDPFTSHGHDGVLDSDGKTVLNDETVEILCKQALVYAQAGCDFVCPSDMMDGRVKAIRHSLDNKGFLNTGILAYSAKFASAFYGPFRQAVKSGARGLDKKNYQLNPANTQEALREIALDIDEGADFILIKPGLPYLDIVHQAKKTSPVPIIIYHVSGEYASLKLAAQQNIVDERDSVFETMICMKRAGASLIITYYAKWICKHLL